ncbi:hypothetical protein KFZ58_07835 [Virgibacillus sp. NKC19-16]|uniref:hypothetical protein n=1 Tax=Virgibacillus salidurans TaxID=2831673 RepID=UPI001F3EEEFB|nr:hypothetical protein [Virgibacillus sp. NKC19-16]UJL47755.1 hypothetical protein KFZ58_07835 [Virgibacillus sp. NKC19-16]
MKKLTFSLRSDLPHGTLIWINASNKKIYYSSKRFDKLAFNEHDSNYLGKAEKICSAKNNQETLVDSLLEKTNRIYGISSNEQVEKSNGVKEVAVLFFSTWEEMLRYAEPYFEDYDQQEKYEQQEIRRKKQAKQEWLERGRRYLQKEKE